MADPNAVYGVGPNQPPKSDPLAVANSYMDLSNSIIRNRLGQVAIQQNTTNLNTQRANRSAQVAYGLSMLPDDQLAGGQPIRDALLQELRTGTLDQNTYNQYVSNLPPATQADGSATPASVFRQTLTQHLIGTLGGQEAINNVVGTPSQIDNGQQIQPGVRAGVLSQNPGAFTASGQPVQTFPSRAQLASPTPTVNSEGQPGTVPLVNTLPPNLAGPGASIANPGVQGAPSPTNQPRLPGVQPQPGTANQPGPQAGNGGFNPTGLPPGSASTMEASATQYANDRAQAGQYASRTFPLQQAINLYKAGVTTGPGSELINQAKSFLLARASNLGLDPNKVNVANFDELNKYLTNYINSQPMAGGSDARLASAITGNPSVHISDLAGADVSKALLGIERMKQAAILNYKGTPQGYADYLKHYSSTVDPRGFIGDFLAKDPTKLNKMLSNMSPGELARFKSSYELAKNNGLLTTNALPTEGQ